MDKNSKICAVVLGENLAEFLVQLTTAQRDADIVELRLDYIKDINLETVKLIKEKTHKSAIICCRSSNHGGKFQGSIEEQQAILQAANDLRFDFIDVDLAIATTIKIKNKLSKIILSHHDFEKTPSLQELTQLALKMQHHNPDILKFAVFTRNDADVQLVLTFLLDKMPQQEMIAIGMGEAGKITRVLSPLLGGYLTFAAVNGSPSAPGQIDIKTMKELYRKINDSFIIRCIDMVRSNRIPSWEMFLKIVRV